MNALFVASCCFYVVPFFVQHLWWLILFFPATFMFALAHKRPSSIALILWVFVSYSLLLFAIAQALFSMACGSYIQKLILPLLTILIVCLPASLLLLATALLAHRYTRSIFTRLIVITIGTWLMALWIDHYCFLLVGHNAGFIFANPLLPLTSWPKLLWLLPIIGTAALMLLFFASGATIAALLVAPQTRTIIAFLIIITMWTTGIFQDQSKNRPPPWLAHTVCIPLSIPRQSMVGMQHALQKIISQALLEHPQTRLILMPELSYPSLEIATEPLLSIPHHVSICMGTNYYLNGSRLNTCYFQCDNQPTVYAKRGLVACVESLPTWLPSCLRDVLASTLFATKKPALAGSMPPPQLLSNSHPPLIPYICSELFLADAPTDSFPRDPILALCSDWWFAPYFKRLMASAAQFRAIQWSRPILYIAYGYALFFDEFGNSYSVSCSGKLL